jgi:hypothetical protein
MLYKRWVCEFGTKQKNIYEIHRRNRGIETLATYSDEKKIIIFVFNVLLTVHCSISEK